MAFLTPQDSIDAKIRLVAFKWLEEQCCIYGETLPRKLLERGFLYEGVYIPLISPQGIFKPKIFPEFPLTITTSPDSPYKDRYVQDQYLHYKYRGTDPEHRDNRGLRATIGKNIPLIYFFGVNPGRYVPEWPVYVVGDDRENLTFQIVVDEKLHFSKDTAIPDKDLTCDPGDEIAKRRYLTVQAKRRLHQQRFRARVLEAYREQCAMCRLKHFELLEAVHIIPDSDPKGDPVISNGISLCNLHHTAFDRFILGIRPDFVIEIREDVLKEEDGPILVHGLQGLNHQKIYLPQAQRNYPDPSRLEVRYEKFKSLAA